MALSKQRKTSDLANVVVTDATNNVTLPNNLTITALISAGMIKADSTGKIVPAIAGTDYMAPGSGGTNIYTADGTLTSNRTLTSGGYNLTFTGSNTASGAIARGILMNHTLMAAANNDVLVGLDINPTFTTGAFSGVTKYAIRTTADVKIGTLYINSGNTYTSINTSTNASNWNQFVSTDGTGEYGIWNDALYFQPLSTLANGFRLYTSSNNVAFNMLQTGDLVFANSQSKFYYSTGNWILGGTTDAGYKLDVQGTGRFTSGLTGTYANFSGNAAFGATTQIGIGGSGGFGGGTGYWLQVVSNNFTINTSGGSIRPIEFIGSNNPLASYTGSTSALSQVNVTNNYSVGIDSYFNQYKAILNATGNASANNLYVRGFFVDSGTLTPNSSTIYTIGFENVSGSNLFNSTSGSTLFGGQYSNLVASAKVQINSTTQGFLPPRMTSTQRAAISTPVVGLIVYQTDGTEGTYEYTSGGWRIINAAGSGGSGTVTSVGLSMPSAFTVSSSPVTTSGTISVTGSGSSSQYIDGTGSLQTFPSFLSSDNLIKEVYNDSGATITKGTVVYISGSHGNLPTIAKALANSDATSAQTLGMVQSDISNNNNGYIVVIGNILNIDTQSYADGTQLYLSGTTAGTYTSTKPYAPTHLVYVGIVVRSHPTQGIISVKIQNGYEMDELHNVDAHSPSNSDGLFYNTSTNLWEHKSISIVLGYTPISLTSISSTATGLTYTNTTGVFSLTSGYAIPTTVKQSNWDDAYTWVSNFPSQTSNAGKFLNTNGSILSWAFPDNIYTANGTLSSARTVTMAGNNLTFSGGNVGIGATASTSYTLNVQNSIADITTSGSSYNYTIFTPTANKTNINSYNGIFSLHYDLSSGAYLGSETYNASSFFAQTAISGNAGTQSTQPIRSGQFTLVGRAGAVAMNISDFRFLDIKSPDYASVSGHVVGTMYGLKIAALKGVTGFTVTNGWGVYQEGASDNNYFSGKVLIGTNSDAGAYALQTTGQVRLNSYTSTSSYTGTAVGYLAFDSSGNIITVATAGSSFLTVNNPAYTGVLTTGTLGYSATNHMASLQSSVNAYNQFVVQNSSSGAAASSDVVVNNNLSTDTTYYGDFGINSSAFSGSGSFNLPNATYLAASTGDLVLGTYTSNVIRFVVNSGTTDAAYISTAGNLMIGQSTDAGYKTDINGTLRVVNGILLGANTTSVSALDFTTSGAALKTSPLAGDFEVDSNGRAYYTIQDSNRGVVDTEQYITLTSAYTTPTGTANTLKQLFNSTTNGALTVTGNTTYFFECYFTLSSMSGTSGTFSFGLAGTATYASVAYYSLGLKGAITASSALMSNQTAATAQIVGSATGNTQTTGYAYIKGKVIVSTGGTIIPSFALSVAAAAVVGNNAYFRLTPVGTNTTTNIGNWS